MDRKEVALELHKHGFNCAQSVVCAFANVLGADPMQAYMMAEPFGLGMGDMKSICGALAGACMMVGMKKSDGNMDDPKTKKQCYNTIMMIKAEFEAKNGSTVCKEIKGIETGKVLRSCNGCISDACELLDKYLLGIYPDGEEPEIKVIKNAK